MLEKVVLAQVFSHLNSYNLIINFQSAYRHGHSTEIALLKVANDFLTAMDTGKVSELTLLDLSAAFDTADHNILLHRLEHTFGFQRTALAWFRLYLSDRTQTVSIDGRLSSQLSFVMAFLKVLYLGQFFSSYTLNLTHM